MNKHLQKLMNILQQDESLATDQKQAALQSLKDADKELEIISFKLERTEKVKHTTAILLEETIEELEQKRKAVEAQNRELEIETALERVRTIAMSMKRRDDMLQVCRVISEQLQHLNVEEIRNVQTAIFYETKGTYINYEFYAKHNESLVTEVEYKNHSVQSGFADQMLKGPNEIFIHSFKGKEVQDWYEFQKTTNVFLDTYLETASSLNYYWYSLGPVALGFSTYKVLNEDGTNLFIRFVKVFELSYRRYLDIENAEAQAREAQIEAALERVRAKTMAMHSSEDVGDTVATMFNEFMRLGIQTNRCGILIFSDDPAAEVWTAKSNPGGKANLIIGKLDMTVHPLLQGIHKAWKKKETFYTYTMEGSDLRNYYQALNELEYYPTKFDMETLPSKEFHSDFYFPEGAVFAFTAEFIPDETSRVIKRFAAVFGQTYRRYLDLQKAEEQARESQIQLAMERVRARTMAMQRSDELSETASLLFRQVSDFGIKVWSSAFQIWNTDDISTTAWASAPDGSIQAPFRLPYDEDIFFKQIYKARQNGKDFFVMESSSKELEATYNYMFNLPAVKKYFDDAQDLGFPIPQYQITHCAFFLNGYLMFITYEPVPEMWDIFKRFAKVFEQTYTRFLDLQKAEAQARESQIQLALERVRARTMSMQHSDELKEAAALLFQQAKALGVPAYSCGYNIWEKDDKEFTSWMSTQDGSIINGVPNIPLTEDANFIRYVESKEKGEPFFVLEMRGERMQEHYQYLKTIPAFKAYFDYAISVGFDLPETQIHYLANFSHGNLLFISLAPCPEFHDVFKRFAAVFDQTYTRFLDLQRAEAQAREATKQASLDRVRGQIASMRSTEDLQRITPLIWHELTMLGVPFIRCGVLIIDEVKAEAHIYLSSPDGHSLAAMNLPLLSNTLTANSVAYWRKGLVYTEHWRQEDFVCWMQSMIEQGQVQNPETYQGAAKPPESLHLHFVPFTQGMLYVGNTALLTDDEIDLVKSLAEAFSIAYARYEDFTKLEKAKRSIEITLTELKATQTQLIQSEKMASLGELTAGIAHEIQNPLNFVNNFSEVNQELLAEMTEEIEKGNFEEVKLLAKDVSGNEEKINHHGKRADAIVKGMLQHSRSSTGVKEPTDINTLADEYLRLTYHGLRAKDKSFNATVKTDFEKGLEKVNIIPQDIGRVILNLITNAFYAVTEKKNASTGPEGQSYEPTVTVSTKQNDTTVEIKVADNGNGIPQKVLDKIFQPFFTTKPTGQGTGLGLSLSYDIVKAHGGEIRVETKEREGTEFIIQLTINTN